MTYRDIGLAARALAVAGGAATLAHFRRDGLAVDRKDDSSPVTAADRAADAVIAEGLAARFPDIPIVSEEREETQQRVAALPRFFLVDPLDGTKEFISGRGDFTVNIALIENGVPVLGAVFAPAKERLFWTPEPGAAVQERGAAEGAAPGETAPLRVADADNGALRVVASKSHRDAETDAFIGRYQVAEVVSAGSSLKFCLLAGGEADLYPRFGPTMEWDTAAADAVLRAAGGRVDQAAILGAADGALRYGKADLRNPAFVAYAPSVAL